MEKDDFMEYREYLSYQNNAYMKKQYKELFGSSADKCLGLILGPGNFYSFQIHNTLEAAILEEDECGERDPIFSGVEKEVVCAACGNTINEVEAKTECVNGIAFYYCVPCEENLLDEEEENLFLGRDEQTTKKIILKDIQVTKEPYLLKNILQRGMCLNIFYNEDSIYNQIIHIRSVVDGEMVVYRWFHYNSGGWRYEIKHVCVFEMYLKKKYIKSFSMDTNEETKSHDSSTT